MFFQLHVPGERLSLISWLAVFANSIDDSSTLTLTGSLVVSALQVCSFLGIPGIETIGSCSSSRHVLTSRNLQGF